MWPVDSVWGLPDEGGQRDGNLYPIQNIWETCIPFLVFFPLKWTNVCISILRLAFDVN